MDPTMQSQQPFNQQQVPPQTISAVPQENKKNFSWKFFIAFIVLVLLGIGLLFLRNYQMKIAPQQSSQPAVVSGKDQAKVIDLSPSIPNSKKTVVLIELSDSSFEKVIMESNLVAGYIKSLPEGDRVISQSPAGK